MTGVEPLAASIGLGEIIPPNYWKLYVEPPMLKVKRLHPDAILPKYQTAGAACFDFHAIAINGFSVAEHEVLKRAHKIQDVDYVTPGKSRTFRTGWAIEVPDGFVLMLYSRSGHGFSSDVRMANCVGVIDSDYRGELRVKLTADEGCGLNVKHGDRIAQGMLIPVQQWQLWEVDELSTTERGEKGYGSTGA